jgi:hypothetical protein
VLAVAAIGVSSKRAPTRWLVQLVQHRALCLAVTAAAQSGVAVSSPGTIYPYDLPGRPWRAQRAAAPPPQNPETR